MAQKVYAGREIALRVQHKAGVLAKVSSLLSAAGVNIEGIIGYAEDTASARIMFVTSDTQKASQVLKDNGYTSILEHSVVVAELENKPGALNHLTEQLAEKDINIIYLYGSANAATASAKIILSTSDNEKTVKLLT